MASDQCVNKIIFITMNQSVGSITHLLAPVLVKEEP